MINLLIFILIPLLATGLVHHFIIIPNDYFRFLAFPLDFGIKFRGKRLLGKSKTFRGLVLVSLLNGLMAYITYKLFNLNLENPALVGALLGFAYSLGELPTSFIKRRLDIPPSGQAGGNLGVTMYVMEQSDSIISTLIAANLFFSITPTNNLYLLLIGTVVHIIVDQILYLRGYKKDLGKPYPIKILLNLKRKL